MSPLCPHCGGEANKAIGRLSRRRPLPEDAPVLGEPGDGWSEVPLEPCRSGEAKRHIPALFEANSHEVDGMRFEVSLDVSSGLGEAERALCCCALDLSYVSVKEMRLRGSSFIASRMVRFLAIGCDLREVDFSRASLWRASFQNCDLRGANFDDTLLSGSHFRECDVREVRGLESADEMEGARFSRVRLSREVAVLARLN